MLIFISGGVRSGKSSYAAKVAATFASDVIHYIATCQVEDSEMVSRIKKHQEDRENDVHNWKTWEKSLNIHEIIPNFHSQSVVIIDCLTTLVANEMFSQNEPYYTIDPNKLIERLENTILSYAKNISVTIVISNEIFYDANLYDSTTNKYLFILGNLHQRIVKSSDAAFLVESGIPIKMKGKFLE